LLLITALVAALVLAASAAGGWRLGALAGVGVMLGAALVHASFAGSASAAAESTALARPWRSRAARGREESVISAASTVAPSS